MKTVLEGRLIPVRSIVVPESYKRTASLVEDDALLKSIEQSGIQQPLIVFSSGKNRYSLIDGARRLDIARHLEIETVPCVVDTLPADADPQAYQNRLRFILDEHRQDLMPSQRATLIKQLMAMFKMKQKHVAAYLGVDAGSITNWLAIDNYIEPVVKAMDSGELTAFAARSFDGLTPEGQQHVWKAHRAEFRTTAAGNMHKSIRARYTPEAHPEFYVSPEKTAAKLNRTRQKRTAKERPRLSKSEKDSLLKDLGLRETELKDSREELDNLKRAITAATPPLRAILRDKELVSMIPKEMMEELERFAEIYV